MTFDEFKQTLSLTNPPEGLSKALLALWHDGNGNWDKSHDIAQEIHTQEGSWIHAYLHRKEGDLGNASYWYRLAGKPVSKSSLHDEWEELVKEFLR